MEIVAADIARRTLARSYSVFRLVASTATMPTAYATILCLVGLSVAIPQSHAWGQDSTANLSTTAKQDQTLKPAPPTNTNAPVSFQLKPAPIAPTGAGGSAQASGNTLAVHLRQLGPGKYDVQVVRGPGGTAETLGTITIVDPTSSPSRQATDNKKEASANPESVHVEADASITLPRGLDPREISRVRIAGAGGNTVLDSGAR
jgi:hypothetical protein